MMHEPSNFLLFGLLELPFLFIAIYFAFRVATHLKGGAFGTGMQFLAWGFVVMAAGHLHMQIARYTDIDLFQWAIGRIAGDAVWVIALAATWALTAYGFLLIDRASRRS